LELNSLHNINPDPSYLTHQTTTPKITTKKIVTFPSSVMKSTVPPKHPKTLTKDKKLVCEEPPTLEAGRREYPISELLISPEYDNL
jgi:hypothetical protein